MIYADRVQETTTTTGTGSIALGGAVAAFRTFAAALTTGDEVTYCVAGASEWEVGRGTFTAPSTLSRAEVYSSSNSGSAVDFAAGSKRVFVTQAAERIGALDTITGPAALGKLTTGAGATTAVPISQAGAASSIVATDASSRFVGVAGWLRTGGITIEPTGVYLVDGDNEVVHKAGSAVGGQQGLCEMRQAADSLGSNWKFLYNGVEGASLLVDPAGPVRWNVPNAAHWAVRHNGSERIKANAAGVEVTSSLFGGSGSTATGAQSFAFGLACSASSPQSFAFGNDAIASGEVSMAGGLDVTTEQTYGVSFGSHILNRAVAAVALGENLTVQTGCANAVSIGFQQTLGATAPYAVALGSYVGVSAGATGAFVCGISAQVKRPGQFQHSSGAGNYFAGTAWIDLHAAPVGVAAALTDRQGAAFFLDLASYSALRVEVMASTRDGVKRAREVREVEAVVSNVGAVTIVSDDVVSGAGDLTAAGWSLTITAQASGELRLTFDPGSDTVAIGARVSWAQLGGINAIPA